MGAVGIRHRPCFCGLRHLVVRARLWHSIDGDPWADAVVVADVSDVQARPFGARAGCEVLPVVDRHTGQFDASPRVARIVKGKQARTTWVVVRPEDARRSAAHGDATCFPDAGERGYPRGDRAQRRLRCGEASREHRGRQNPAEYQSWPCDHRRQWSTSTFCAWWEPALQLRRR